MDPRADHWIEASGSEKGPAGTLEAARPGGTVVVVALYGQLPSVEIRSHCTQATCARRQLFISSDKL